MRFPGTGVVTEQRIENLAFKGGKFGRAATSWTWQINHQIKRHATLVDQNDPITQGHSFTNIMGHQQSCKT